MGAPGTGILQGCSRVRPPSRGLIALCPVTKEYHHGPCDARFEHRARAHPQQRRRDSAIRVWRLPDQAERHPGGDPGALQVGYRHIDTAQMYRNEREWPRRSLVPGIDRADIFITSKLNNGSHRPEKALAAVRSLLEEMKIDYLDLFLIHWPLPAVYKAITCDMEDTEEIHHAGRVRAIGVSNFQVHHLDRLSRRNNVCRRSTRSRPTRTSTRRCPPGSGHGIATEAWSPIAQGKVLDDPGSEHRRALGRSPAGDFALAYSARRHRLPEVGHAGRGCRRTSRFSTSS